MKNLLLVVIIILSVSCVANKEEKNAKHFVEKRPISLLSDVQCEGQTYSHTAFYSDNPSKPEVSTVVEKNSKPFIIKIKKLSEENVMVDNDKFLISNNRPNDFTAVFIDEKNIITIVVNSDYGQLLYNKTFTNSSYGKQNTMAFIAQCRNI